MHPAAWAVGGGPHWGLLQISIPYDPYKAGMVRAGGPDLGNHFFVYFFFGNNFLIATKKNAVDHRLHFKFKFFIHFLYSHFPLHHPLYLIFILLISIFNRSCRREVYWRNINSSYTPWILFLI